jgi:hypothetical protein
MKRPIDRVWSGRELRYDIAEAIKRPAPKPSTNLANMVIFTDESIRRRTPETIVSRSPALIKYADRECQKKCTEKIGGKYLAL